MSERIQIVELFRDSLNTPWGFRLTGGKDLKQSLSIQKIKPGTPAHGEIEAGDVLVEIQRQDAFQMTHKQAQDLIKNAGGSLKLKVLRCSYGVSKKMTSQPTGPKGTFLLQRLHDTLTDAVIGRGPTRGTASPRVVSPVALQPFSPHYYEYPEEPHTWQVAQVVPKTVPIPKETEYGWMPQILKNKKRQPNFADGHPTQIHKNLLTMTHSASPRPSEMGHDYSTGPVRHFSPEGFRHFSPPSYANDTKSPENNFSNIKTFNVRQMDNLKLYSRPTVFEPSNNFSISPHAGEEGKDNEETVSEIATHRPSPAAVPSSNKHTDF